MSGWAPLEDVTVFHTGERWVVLGWTELRPNAVQVYGPFRTKSSALAFGKEHFPRRYQIGGVMSAASYMEMVRRKALDDEEMNEH